MNALVHARGDLLDMFLLFFFLMLGLWQTLVAWKKLNGLSLTGCPDRKYLSTALGLVLIFTSGAWYFSQPGHFAAPDVEGVETLVLLTLGIAAATAAQFLLSAVAGFIRSSVIREKQTGEIKIHEEGVRIEKIDTGESPIPAFIAEAKGGSGPGIPVLLVHDYGGSKEDLEDLALFLASNGHRTLAFDIDGHGMNERGLDSLSMPETVGSLLKLLTENNRNSDIAVAGIGFGGYTAVSCAAYNDRVRHAVAVDPPALESEGICAVNAMRELNIIDVLSSAFRPPARGAGGKRISLSSLFSKTDFPESTPPDKVTVIGTKDTWLNSPRSLEHTVSLLGLKDPVPAESRHYSLALREDVRRMILDSIRD